MNKIIKLLLVAINLMMLSACALTPESVKLNPQINVASNNIGHGKKVAVRVIDARPEQTLGGRATAYGPAAKIKLANDIKKVVRSTVTQGLKKYNFTPTPYNHSISSVRITTAVTHSAECYQRYTHKL